MNMPGSLQITVIYYVEAYRCYNVILSGTTIWQFGNFFTHCILQSNFELQIHTINEFLMKELKDAAYYCIFAHVYVTILLICQVMQFYPFFVFLQLFSTCQLLVMCCYIFSLHAPSQHSDQSTFSINYMQTRSKLPQA